MARATTIIVRDDLDGTEIEGSDGTVLFSLDGEDYEIDLSDANQARLSQALALYIECGRKVTAVTRLSRYGRRRGAYRIATRNYPVREISVARTDTEEIREWARSEGYDVRETGQLPLAVIGKYDQCRTDE
jgi:hypothetical protein